MTPWTAAHHASLSITNYQSLLKCMSILLVMPSHHLILYHNLLLPSIFPSIRVFSNESNELLVSDGQSIWASALASVLPMNIQDWFPLGLSGLISCQPKGLSRVSSKNHSSKASILWHSAFFMAHISQSYMTTGKTTALTIWTFVGKVNLLFNMLSRFVITFLQNSKSLLISFNHEWGSTFSNQDPRKRQKMCRLRADE